MKLLLILIILALMITITPAFADTKNLSGNSHGSEISLTLSDGIASGVITLKDHSIELNDIKVIERNDRLYIIDKQNDLKIFSKQITSDKYIIIVKINSKDIQTKLRFIANSENIHKNINQRNLFEAMEQKP